MRRTGKVVKAGTFPVFIVDETGGGDTLYEPILGGKTIAVNGLPLEHLHIRVDGAFAQVTADVEGVLYRAVFTMTTPSTVVMLADSDTRLGIIVSTEDYLVFTEDISGNRRQVPIEGYPDHARILIGAFLLWNYLLHRDFVKQQPTH